MTQAHNSGVSRRTIVKGAAWSVPVIAMGSALPAFAATPGIFTLDGKGCKLPGGATDLFKGYAFGVTATNTFPVPIIVTINSLTLNGEDLGDVLIVQTDPNNAAVCNAQPLNTLGIPANTTLTDLVVLTQNAANSANGTLTVTYTVSGGPGGTFNDSQSVNASPPIVGGSCRDFTAAQKDCLENIGGF